MAGRRAAMLASCGATPLQRVGSWHPFIIAFFGSPCMGLLEGAAGACSLLIVLRPQGTSGASKAHTLFPRVPCHVKVLPGTPFLSAFLLRNCESCVRFFQWSRCTWPQSPSCPRTGLGSSRCSRSHTAGYHCKCAASRPCKPGKSYELICLSYVFFGFGGCTCLAARVLRPRPHPLTFFHCLLRV